MPNRRRISRLSPERRTADIMAAAREVFSEKGFNDTLISDIAERAGVVEGSLYRYFENKRDLLFRVAEDWFEEMIDSDEATLIAISGGRNRLRYVIHRHLTAIRTEPAMSRLVFQHLRPDPQYRETRLFALHQQYTRQLVSVVEGGRAAGEFRKDVSARLVRDLVYGCVEHRTWAFLRGEGDFDTGKLADDLADLVFSGIRTPRTAGGLNDAVDRLEAVTEAITGQAI